MQKVTEITNAKDDSQLVLIPEGVLRLVGPGRKIVERCDGQRTVDDRGHGKADRDHGTSISASKATALPPATTTSGPSDSRPTRNASPTAR